MNNSDFTPEEMKILKDAFFRTLNSKIQYLQDTVSSYLQVKEEDLSTYDSMISSISKDLLTLFTQVQVVQPEQWGTLVVQKKEEDSKDINFENYSVSPVDKNKLN